eukprot:MONOS_1574.1-p1 / transcript=MONOS_1574.1 / gene=MONOS_1574 / organism=Monocercomonoides_exilis_PA203 / gene_product=unspecified product / transcript_product=unspecified product / location=Mono_scaffold00028:86694-88004(-) / protein_length=293 / sequence_SO=supercontig / SO=protein_coding / is_pseudo=false
MPTILRTTMCWVALLITLAVGIIVAVNVKYHFALTEESEFIYWPMGERFDFTGETDIAISSMDNCLVVGANEMKDFTTELQRKQLHLDLNQKQMCSHEVILPSMTEPVKFISGKLSVDTNYTITTLKDHQVILSEGIVNAGKEVEVPFKSELRQTIRFCYVTDDEEDFKKVERQKELNTVSLEANVMAIPVDLKGKTDCSHNKCPNITNFYATPLGINAPCYFAFQQYLPTYLLVLLGIVPFIFALLFSMIAAFKTTIGCCAYPCYVHLVVKDSQGRMRLVNMEEGNGLMEQ